MQLVDECCFSETAFFSKSNITGVGNGMGSCTRLPDLENASTKTKQDYLENQNEEVFAEYGWIGCIGHGVGARLRRRSGCATGLHQGAPDGVAGLRLEGLLHRRQRG